MSGGLSERVVVEMKGHIAAAAHVAVKERGAVQTVTLVVATEARNADTAYERQRHQLLKHRLCRQGEQPVSRSASAKGHPSQARTKKALKRINSTQMPIRLQ